MIPIPGNTILIIIIGGDGYPVIIQERLNVEGSVSKRFETLSTPTAITRRIFPPPQQKVGAKDAGELGYEALTSSTAPR